MVFFVCFVFFLFQHKFSPEVTKYFSSLYFHSQFFSSAKALCSEHFKANCSSKVSSIFSQKVMIFFKSFDETISVYSCFFFSFLCFPHLHKAVVSSKALQPVFLLSFEGMSNVSNLPQKIHEFCEEQLLRVCAVRQVKCASLSFKATLSGLWASLCSKSLDVGRWAWQLNELLHDFTIIFTGALGITIPAAGCYPFHKVWPVLSHSLQILLKS